jgi:hypothetical protein
MKRTQKRTDRNALGMQRTFSGSISLSSPANAITSHTLRPVNGISKDGNKLQSKDDNKNLSGDISWKF